MVEIRSIAADEAEAFRSCVMTTFGGGTEEDPRNGDWLRALLAPGRAWAAFEGGSVVATAGTFGLTVGVPGGSMPMAGLTMVSVRPTHRRRGLLRELMRLHIEDARQHGEAINALWASEATIYGRFGFGIAVESDALTIDTRGLGVASIGEPDPCVWIEQAEALERLPAIYARAMAGRPGALYRDVTWWRERRFLELPSQRAGASMRRYVVVRRGDEDVGYIVYRQRPEFRDALPTGATEIIEVIAVDPRAEASLWQFVAGIDLFPIAKWSNAPSDSVLPWIALDSNRVSRRRISTLWLRIDEVAAALASRRYAVDGALRFSVGGATWSLVVEAGQGRCTPTDAAPEIDFAGTTLGSVFLGSVAVATLARAGRITGSDEAVARANRLFAWPLAAWCPEIF
ncbi:MAG: GNAT family N-acetyltransferase [Myxococcales bacterium]|nr:GNAT family N-acetyltransferase [Myxococcales bacterium]